LTPRRFGPGIDLLRSVGAEPGLAPEPAPDEDLLLVHTARYLDVVKRFSEDPWRPPEAGIGLGGDDPPFTGMHEAAASVADGSLRAIEAILRGDVEHAFHPGGGLHHAMRDRASGFCIYDDPALAIARARRDGLRVLYLDFDVHHGDGVEAIHLGDPGVMTVSFHESGRYLFPGTGFVDDIGNGEAAGTAVNVPFEPLAGEQVWLAAVRSIVPAIAAAFGPDLVVSQHGADGHAWDPLAHLRLTTTAMGEAARLVDRVAHRWADGRWLSTGGGGYDAYRVVPRTWSLVWLAGAHREAPEVTPVAWRERWAAEGERHGQSPPPTHFADPPNAGLPMDAEQEAAERESETAVALARLVAVPALLREAPALGWWDPLHDDQPALRGARAAAPVAVDPLIIEALTPDALERLTLEPRVIPPADPDAAQALLAAVLAAPADRRAEAAAAIAGDRIVAVAIVGPATPDRGRPLLALGVAPAYRGRGVAARLLRGLVGRVPGEITATVTVAERDPVEPLDHALRRSIARRLLEGAGFGVQPAEGLIARADPAALVAVRPAQEPASGG